MKYIPQMDHDSLTWEIIGVGEIFFSAKRDSFTATFFCQSLNNETHRQNSGQYKFIKLPIENTRDLVPGSMWKSGKRISARTFGGHWVNLRPYEEQHIFAENHMPPHEIVQALSRAENPKEQMLSHLNLIQLECPHAKLIIPCSEVFRHYMTPTIQYAKLAMSDEFQAWLPEIIKGESIPLPKGRKKLNASEYAKTILLSSSPLSIEACQHPLKNLKLTNINNGLGPFRKNLLISAKMPFGNKTRLRVSGYTMHKSISADDRSYTFIVDRIHESDHREHLVFD